MSEFTKSTPSGSPSNLPPQLTSFIGRQAELAQLVEELEHGRLVTLTGAGGCGKTRLALAMSGNVLNRFADGVWWVDLSPVSSAEMVAYSVARSLGFRAQPNRTLVDTLSEQLSGLDALLVLDNCEQVLDECARLIDALVRAAPR